MIDRTSTVVPDVSLLGPRKRGQLPQRLGTAAEFYAGSDVARSRSVRTSSFFDGGTVRHDGPKA